MEAEQLKAALNLHNADFEALIDKERAFLKGLKDEPEEKILECAYIHALKTKQKAEYVTIFSIFRAAHVVN